MEFGGTSLVVIGWWGRLCLRVVDSMCRAYLFQRSLHFETTREVGSAKMFCFCLSRVNNLTIWRKIWEKKYLESTCCQIDMIRAPIERSRQKLSLSKKLQIGQVPAKLWVKTWSPKSGLRQGPFGKSLTHLAH